MENRNNRKQIYKPIKQLLSNLFNSQFIEFREFHYFLKNNYA